MVKILGMEDEKYKSVCAQLADWISIATYALQLISQELFDKKLPVIFREIISTGTFSKPLQISFYPQAPRNW